MENSDAKFQCYLVNRRPWLLRIYFGAFFHVKTYLRSARSTSRAFSFVLASRLRFNDGMPALTRRRSADRPDCWHIEYGDVQAGTIAMRVGNPHDTDQWEWSCGFYPGSRPGEIQSGTSATFDDARAEFAGAWKIFFANHTETDFQAWRYQRDSTAQRDRHSTGTHRNKSST